MDANLTELYDDGWLVNQTRMWLSSQWTVRAGARWRDGEDAFFTHLLDGSGAANRLGWQWTVGSGTGKACGCRCSRSTPTASPRWPAPSCATCWSAGSTSASWPCRA